MDSILQDKKECFLCHTTQNLHRHHVFEGTANRKQSEKYGMVIWLCAPHHNMSDAGIHFDRAFDLAVKRKAQAKYEETHTREEFREVFGKSFL